MLPFLEDMKTAGVLALAVLLVASLGCTALAPAADPVATPGATPDLGATVQAAVSAALPTATPTTPPDVSATLSAGIAATRAASPTETPVPPPTPDIDATVEARMAATIAAAPTHTPTQVPAPTSAAALGLAATPAIVPTAVIPVDSTPATAPTATRRPAPTATPRPTATRQPTPTPTPWPTSTRRPSSPNTTMTLSEMVRQARPAVVRIGTTTSVGTGVIFETSGQSAYAVTNEHVISGHRQVSVVVNDTDPYMGTVLGSDPVRDLAVISICCGRFHALPFGNAAGLQPGDEVIAIGYALGLSGQASITRGIVSAIRYDSSHLSNVIQTDAAINPGNSGGPMLSMSGEILGINTFSIDQSGSGRPAEGLGFAVSGTTVEAQIPALRTASANPTPTPQSRVQPTRTPSPGAGTSPDEGYVYGPVNGELRHEPQDGFLESFRAGVSMSDAAVSATFVNPYSTSNGPWDYGFLIRNNSGQAFLRVLVRSTGRWEVRMGTGTSSQDRMEGALPTFNPRAGQRNSIVFFAAGNRGVMFVNGQFVSLFDLSRVPRTGDISVITGVFSGSEVRGASTRYESFQAIQLEKRYGPTSATLQGEANRVTEYRTGLRARDLIIEADFVNPRGSNWDYGFVIRNPGYDQLDIVGVNDEGRWFHMARSPGSGRYVDAGGGSLSHEGVSFRARNHVMLLAFGDAGLFLVNGKLVAKLSLFHNQGSGNVVVLANFFRGHQGSPNFSNLNVWTP